MLLGKRDDYLEWPEYFMAVAFLSAQRSKDPSSQVSLPTVLSLAVFVPAIFCRFLFGCPSCLSIPICVCVCVCVCVFFLFVSGGKTFQWEFVHGLLENAIYGGRMDNLCDLRILRSYLLQFFSARLLGSGQARGRKSSPFPAQINLPSSCSALVSLHTHSQYTHVHINTLSLWVGGCVCGDGCVFDLWLYGFILNPGVVDRACYIPN